MKKIWIALGLLIGTTPTAWADNVAHCEILLTQTIADADGNGEAQIASYRPAVNFLSSLYDEDKDSHMTEVDNFPIQAVLCRRNDVIPAKADYNILATGIPFILSQDFDQSETDILTAYWKDGAFKYDYKGFPLSDEAQKVLVKRLAEFSARGLVKKKPAEDGGETAEIEAKVETETTPDIEILVEGSPVEGDTDLEAETPSKIEIKE